jgi:YfiH family protein
MVKNFEILIPEMFPKNKIISGVTKRNLHLFPDKGFTISNADTFSLQEIETHRKFLAEVLCVEYKRLKFQKQVHKTDIQIVTQNTPNGLETDGMITSEKGLILNVSIADCLAILIYDPINEIIAAIHSGWRSTKDNIAGKGIQLLLDKYNSNPWDLLVYLSPCASGRNYEVGYDVAKYFPENTIQINKNKFLFDNQKQVFNQLIESGVNRENIEASDICTIANPEYHSFRRDKDKSGRMSAFIAMLMDS